MLKLFIRSKNLNSFHANGFLGVLSSRT